MTPAPTTAQPGTRRPGTLRIAGGAFSDDTLHYFEQAVAATEQSVLIIVPGQDPSRPGRAPGGRPSESVVILMDPASGPAVAGERQWILRPRRGAVAVEQFGGLHSATGWELVGPSGTTLLEEDQLDDRLLRHILQSLG
jgi:hypothetical protein